MTNTEKLLMCIANAGGPIRSRDLELQTGIPTKNHSGLLSSPITRGLVHAAMIIGPKNRKCLEYRIGTSYTPKNAADMMKPIPHEIDASNGRSILRTDFEIEQAAAHHHAQPEVAQNTGSAGQHGSPPVSAAGPAQLQINGEGLAPTLESIYRFNSAIKSTQIGGTHYVSKSIQPWDAMEAWMTYEEFCGFLRGYVIKYIARANDKGGIEDLRKGWHYLQKLLEVMERHARENK